MSDNNQDLAAAINALSSSVERLEDIAKLRADADARTPRPAPDMVEVPLHVVQAMQRVCEAAKKFIRKSWSDDDYDDAEEILAVALADLERARKGAT